MNRFFSYSRSGRIVKEKLYNVDLYIGNALYYMKARPTIHVSYKDPFMYQPNSEISRPSTKRIDRRYGNRYEKELNY
jgi:hypothetical protein